MPLRRSPILGPYEILAPLGSGGMGEVYRATDTKLGRAVALRLLAPALAGDADYMARFTREAQVLASLNHHSIAAIYGLEESNGVRALVMELVEGPTLAERIAAGPLPLEETLHIAKQIADALEAAHEKGIVHRDLKPANVKITPEGVVKVLDFGLAKAPEQSTAISASSPTLTMRATQAGVIMGTAAYMSPEQAAAKPVDKRADIWSFGVVLWEMLTGRQLFSGETISHTLADVLRAEIDVRKLPAGTPQAIRDLVRRCLDRDTKTRLRDIGEARIAIQKYLADPTSTPVTTLPIRRNALPWAVAAVAAVAALGALAFAYYNRASEEPRTLRFFVAPPEKATFNSFSPPALSPDGRRLAFVADTGGKRQIWVRDLDSLAARPLTGTEDAFGPFWSPDSRRIGFFASGKLKKIEVAGGPAQTLCSAAAGRGSSWSQNGVIVFTPGFTSPLYRVPETGGEATQLTTFGPLGENSHRYPWFLPDGRHFLYLAASSDWEKTAAYIGDLESKDRRRLIAANSAVVYTPPGFLLFLREGTLMAQAFHAGRAQIAGDPFPVAEQLDTASLGRPANFSVSQNGVLAYLAGGAAANQQLTWFDRTGKPLGTVGQPGVFVQPAISPDGSTVAVGRLDPQAGTYDIWLHNLARGTASRFTFDPGTEFDPLWSPDGAHIVFNSNRDGPLNLYEKASSGAGGEKVLLKSPLVKWPEDWSRDGRFLIYEQVDPKTKNDIWVLPMTGDQKPFPYLQSASSPSAGLKLSPDGRWLAYTSDETGRS